MKFIELAIRYQNAASTKEEAVKNSTEFFTASQRVDKPIDTLADEEKGR